MSHKLIVSAFVKEARTSAHEPIIATNISSTFNELAKEEIAMMEQGYVWVCAEAVDADVEDVKDKEKRLRRSVREELTTNG